MKKNISLLILSIGIVGCASPAYNYQTVPKNISKPPIGSVNKAFVGDQMLEQGIVVDREVLNIPENIKISFAYSLTSGIYLKTGQNEKGQYFQPFNTVSGGGMVQKNLLADPFKVVMLDNESKLCVVTVFNAKNCTDKHQAIMKTVAIASDNSFQQTLIYSGKFGNKINVGYREFSSNQARPAFNNDVEYDLSQSKQIGYKGALLEVIDATNQDITYKVLKNFNKVD
ncbi:hypothetical protein ACEN3H_08565 [Acinetobacter lactucae]|uniref:hypothetical protein n=1 Tax=Acinetobacter lactucae TaxID=1785128 RepID=UPI00358DB2A2